MARRYELAGDYETLIEHYFAQGWTDGLPIVPPSPLALDRMIEASHRVKDEVVAVIPPDGGEATVEAVAINAILAGCRPEHFRVVLAAVEAIADPAFNLHAIQTTTNPAAVMLVVNGPVARAVEINSKSNCLGPGTRANAVIGRAVRLVMLNVGGGIPGAVDQATHGQPGKFTMCFAENEEDSPWEPWHVEHGFRREDSTVTAISVTGTQHVLDASSKTADGVLHTLAGSCGNAGDLNAQIGGAPTIILGPEHAALIAQAGHSKAALKDAIFQRARVPLAAFSADTVTQRVRERRAQLFAGGREPASVPVADAAADINVFVAGGPGSHSVYCPSFGPSTRPSTRVVPARGA
jgi:hypothetical protein